MPSFACEPGELQLEQRPAPRAPGRPGPGPSAAGSGICGTDYHIFEGTHPFLDIRG